MDFFSGVIEAAILVPFRKAWPTFPTFPKMILSTVELNCWGMIDFHSSSQNTRTPGVEPSSPALSPSNFAKIGNPCFQPVFSILSAHPKARSLQNIAKLEGFTTTLLQCPDKVLCDQAVKSLFEDEDTHRQFALAALCPAHAAKRLSRTGPLSASKTLPRACGEASRSIAVRKTRTFSPRSRLFSNLLPHGSSR